MSISDFSKLIAFLLVAGGSTLSYALPANETAPLSDPLYKKQRALHIAELAEADDIFFHPDFGIKSTVKIGVIDRGELNVDHPDLKGVVSSYEAVKVDDDGDHGQTVTGVLAARSFNGMGIRGAIGSHANIHYRGVENSLDARLAFESLLDEGVDVINVSLGMAMDCPPKQKKPFLFFDSKVILSVFSSPNVKTKKCRQPLNYSSQYADVLRRAVLEKNTVVVVAAGNDRTYLPKQLADFGDGVIVVGAINSSQRKAYYTNYGPGVTMYGPGFDITSLTFDDYSDGHEGTSVAAPIVAGAAALAIAYLRSYGVSYKAADIRALITQSATPLPKLKPEDAEVRGTLNFRNLAAALQTLVELKKH